MNTDSERDRSVAEGRFVEVFAHLGFLVQYARRRGARDPDGIAAEAMTIAWRRLADIPADDPRPWLIGATRNLLLAEHRRDPGARTQPLGDADAEAPAEPLPVELELDPELARALRSLSEQDREALRLVAWDDLTPAQAAASLGISATAFRVRLHRARRRLGGRLARQAVTRPTATPRPDWRHTA